MPILIKRLTPTGLQPVDYAAESLVDAARYEPREGVYTITNTYQTYKTLKLNAHLDRLEQSAALASIPLTLDRARLRAALREMIASLHPKGITEASYGDVRFRVTVSKDEPDVFILSIEPFKPPPPETVTNGVRCVTTPGSARNNPAAKTTGWMHDREAVENSLPPGIYTGLLLGENGDILEGLSSNFYAVLGGELRTAGEGVLGGIAQQIVFEVAPEVLPLRRDAINEADIPRLEEAFVTSSSRAITPVVSIDGVPIGDGKPGAKTLALLERYVAWVNNHLEEL